MSNYTQNSISSGKGKKEIVLPVLIPVGAYEAFRVCCVFMAFDENPNNALNRNSNPIVRVHKSGNITVTVALYGIECMKQCFRVLSNIGLWSREVKVERRRKQKGNPSGQLVSTYVNVKCIHIPTKEEIYAWTNDPNFREDLMFAARQIKALFLSPKSEVDRLLEPTDIPFGTVPMFEHVTSPNNIVKQERLENMGYAKTPLRQEELTAWLQYNQSEINRLKYCVHTVTGSRISDNALRSLSDKRAEDYSDMLITNLVNNMSATQYSSYSSNSAHANKISSGKFVNQGLLSYQMDLATNKAKGDSPSMQKKYEFIRDEYSKLTGHTLNVADEKKGKTLPIREQDLMWMNNVRTSNPNARFRFDCNVPPFGRPFLLEENIASVPPQRTTTPVAPQTNTPAISVTPTTNQSLYSSVPVNAKPQLSSADMQKHMRNISPYPTATKTAMAVPDTNSANVPQQSGYGNASTAYYSQHVPTMSTLSALSGVPNIPPTGDSGTTTTTTTVDSGEDVQVDDAPAPPEDDEDFE